MLRRVCRGRVRYSKVLRNELGGIDAHLTHLWLDIAN